MDESINALSRAQRECLRLVAKGRKSKDIARVTGFAPSTVDTYLSKAANTLGVGSRREAALLFADWEAQQSGKLGFSRSISSVQIDKLPGAENSPFPEAANSDDRYEKRIADFVSLPPIGGRENDLNSEGRLVGALKIAFLSAFAIVAIALILREGMFVLS